MTQTMTPSSQPAARPAILIGGWVVILIAVAALAVAITSLVVTLVGAGAFTGAAPNGYPGMMGGGHGPGMMGRGAYGPGMMGGYGSGSNGRDGYGPGMMGGSWIQPGPQPGDSGFVPGTVSAPRIVHVVAGPDPAFHPSSLSVVRGETVTFLVTTMGPTTHEFMVGPAADVAADVDGTPEIEDIGMMETKALTFTFDGSGPYAFACHVTGHYEAGMVGTVVVVP